MRGTAGALQNKKGYENGFIVTAVLLVGLVSGQYWNTKTTWVTAQGQN